MLIFCHVSSAILAKEGMTENSSVVIKKQINKQKTRELYYSPKVKLESISYSYGRHMGLA